MNAQAYPGLAYSTCDINRNFKIKVNGLVEGAKVNVLVGVCGLVAITGVDLANRLLNRAFNSRDDKQVCKLRRGVKITFYYH